MKSIPIIDEIWIITENGLTLYNQQFLDEGSADLFGGFVSAINAFASEIGMEEVRVIKGKNFKLTLAHYQDHRVSFVCRTPLDQNEDHIYEYLSFLKGKFVEYFGKEIKDWKGSLDDFKEMKEVFNIEQDQLELYSKNIFSSVEDTIFQPDRQISYEKIEKKIDLK